MKMTKVIAGFPGVGKSYFTKRAKELNLSVQDSDSSEFSWSEPGVRNPAFPQNYIEHIKEKLEDDSVDFILVSTHDIVRKALEENQIKYTLVYPDPSLKEEYINRYKERGSDGKFVKLMDTKWLDFIHELIEETYPDVIELRKGQYLGDLDILIDRAPESRLKVGLVRSTMRKN